MSSSESTSAKHAVNRERCAVLAGPAASCHHHLPALQTRPQGLVGGCLDHNLQTLGSRAGIALSWPIASDANFSCCTLQAVELQLPWAKAVHPS